MSIIDIVTKELTYLDSYQKMQNNQDKLNCYIQDYYYYFRCQDDRIIVEIPDNETAHIYNLTKIGNDFVSKNEISINIIDNEYVKNEIRNEFENGKIHSFITTFKINGNDRKEIYNEEEIKEFKHGINSIRKKCKKILDIYEV